MHPFYGRIRTVFKNAGSNRAQFCQKYGHKYQTLQSYWNTEKLPPGNVLVDLSTEYNVSLDALLFGKTHALVGAQDPNLSRLTVLLKQLSEEDLLRIEGAVRMLQFINSTDAEKQDQALAEWAEIEELEEDEQ